MPLGKLSFFAYVISQKRSTNQQNQLQNHVFQVKTIQSNENYRQLDPAKNENRPKNQYTPFLHEGLQLTSECLHVYVIFSVYGFQHLRCLYDVLNSSKFYEIQSNSRTLETILSAPEICRFLLRYLLLISHCCKTLWTSNNINLSKINRISETL